LIDLLTRLAIRMFAAFADRAIIRVRFPGHLPVKDLENFCPEELCMKRQRSIQSLVVPFLVAAVFLSSACAVAEGPIPFNAPMPFNAMMQSAAAQPAVPAKPDVSSQQAKPGEITSGGKTEMIVGAVLMGVGVVACIGTALVSSSGIKPSGDKTAALYAGGAGAAGVGVTLIVLGSHRRTKN
jgi:hypothetical protein